MTRWRSILLLIAGIFFLGLIGVLNDLRSIAAARLITAGLNTGSVRITQVLPGTPAAVAGLHPGDVIDLRDQSATARALLVGVSLHPAPIALTIRRGSQVFHTVLITQHLPQPIFTFLGIAAQIWIFAFAILIAIKRAHVRESRLLVLLMLFGCGAIFLAANNFATPWLWVDLVGWVISRPLLALSVSFFIAFAASFGRRTPLRTTLHATAYAAAAACAILSVLSIIARVALIGPVVPALPLFVALMYALALLCGFAAIGASRGADRQRVAWVVLSLTPLFLLQVANAVAVTAAPSDVHLRSTLTNLTNICGLLWPIGLSYAALQRRVLDVGFALNRAAVFTVVSVIVVGIFVLVEWALGAWFANASHTTSIAVNIAVALILGLSIRFIHRRADQFVDRVLFRKRHEDERALRRLAHEAAFLTDRNSLVNRVVQEVEQHTAASTVTFLVPRGGRYASALGNGVADIDVDDPAMVALRAWREPLDLQTIQTTLSGEWAFPMVVRSQVVGALVCGQKRDGESYAPDEREALATLSQNVGVALHSLSESTETGIASLIEGQREILAELRRLRS